MLHTNFTKNTKLMLWFSWDKYFSIYDWPKRSLS